MKVPDNGLPEFLCCMGPDEVAVLPKGDEANTGGGTEGTDWVLCEEVEEADDEEGA